MISFSKKLFFENESDACFQKGAFLKMKWEKAMV